MRTYLVIHYLSQQNVHALKKKNPILGHTSMKGSKTSHLKSSKEIRDLPPWDICYKRCGSHTFWDIHQRMLRVLTLWELNPQRHKRTYSLGHTPTKRPGTHILGPPNRLDVWLWDIHKEQEKALILWHTYTKGSGISQTGTYNHLENRPRILHKWDNTLIYVT